MNWFYAYRETDVLEKVYVMYHFYEWDEKIALQDYDMSFSKRLIKYKKHAIKKILKKS